MLTPTEINYGRSSETVPFKKLRKIEVLINLYHNFNINQVLHVSGNVCFT